MKKLTLSLTLLSAISISFSQNVGINTDGSAPGMMLDVKPSAGNNGIRINNTADDAIINFQNNGTNEWTLGFDDSDADQFKISQSGVLGTTDAFIIDADRQLMSGITGTAAVPAWTFDADTDIGLYRIGVNTLGFSTTGIEAMRINNVQNVGIGTVPNANNNMLTVEQDGVTGTAEYVFVSNAASAWPALEGYSANTASGTGVQGTGFYAVFGTASTAAGWSGYFDWDTYVDWLFYTGATMVSDRRVKSDIKPIDNAVNLLDGLNPVIYKKKTGIFDTKNESNSEGFAREESDILEYGFIAQEVNEKFPNLVKSKNMHLKNGEDMDVMGVNYTMVIPILTKAIQEQQAYIKTLEARIEALETNK